MSWNRPAAAAALVCALGAAPCAAAPLDLKELFRREWSEAAADLGWRGERLGEHTALAAAASGLSWRPEWRGRALVIGDPRSPRYANPGERLQSFREALQAGAHRIAFPFALSLALDGQADQPGVWGYLEGAGDDLEEVLIGILEAPRRLPLLGQYQYAAADLLVRRASPSLLPLFLALAESSDRHLRSRAVAALGVVGFRRAQGGAPPGLRVPLREHSVSAVQHRLILDAVRRAAQDKNHRVRAAAALALGLLADESGRPLLERLVRDPAVLTVERFSRDDRWIEFPVRRTAAAALARLGLAADPGGGRLSGRALRDALRGSRDVTQDRSDLRRDQLGGAPFHDWRW